MNIDPNSIAWLSLGLGVFVVTKIVYSLVTKWVMANEQPEIVVDPGGVVLEKIFAAPPGGIVRLTPIEIRELLMRTEVTAADYCEIRALMNGAIDNIFGRKIIRG